MTHNHQSITQLTQMVDSNSSTSQPNKYNIPKNELVKIKKRETNNTKFGRCFHDRRITRTWCRQHSTLTKSVIIGKYWKYRDVSTWRPYGALTSSATSSAFDKNSFWVVMVINFALAQRRPRRKDQNWVNLERPWCHHFRNVHFHFSSQGSLML